MKKRTRKGKLNRQKAKLGLPDLEHVKSAVLISLRSPESQRSYRRSIVALSILTTIFICAGFLLATHPARFVRVYRASRISPRQLGDYSLADRFKEFCPVFAAVAASVRQLSLTPLPPSETPLPPSLLVLSSHPSRRTSTPEHHLRGTALFPETP